MSRRYRRAAGLDNWDTHGVPGNPLNFPTLRAQLPTVDKGVSTLIQDLHDRGLNEDVVTIMWGEFGRSPRINNGAGRDHWAPCGSALVAGGGLKMGQVVGASNSRGEFPREARYTGSQVLSTLYRVLGIDPSRTFLNTNGRPMYILDEREPVVELLAKRTRTLPCQRAITFARILHWRWLMITQVEATLIQGLLKPDQSLPLPDQTRVRLTIEPIQEWSPERAMAAWQAIQERLRQRPIHGGGLRMTRDQLHERR